MTHGWKAGRLYAQRRFHDTMSAEEHMDEAGRLEGICEKDLLGY